MSESGTTWETVPRPGGWCEYTFEPDSGYFKPHCCGREAKSESRCVWHARVTGKPGELLASDRIAGRTVEPRDTRDRWLGRGGERLDGAFLRGADLRQVRLTDCTLFDATLDEAVLQGTNLERADLREATATGANFQRARLSNAVLKDADLSDADLRGANLEDADLTGATLEGADLREANLSGADLRRANLREATLQGADLPGTDLHRATLAGTDLIDTDLRGARVQAADCRGLYAMRADLSSVGFREATLAGADLRMADLHEANLRKADLRGADLSRANLTDANATDADLREADLERARATRTDLPGADLRGVRHYGATLEGAQVDDLTALGERVPYDPAWEGVEADVPNVEGFSPGPDDGGEDRDDGEADGSGGGPAAGGTGGDDAGASTPDPASVADLRKAAESYRLREGLARDNGYADLRVESYLRRKDVRRLEHRREGRYVRWARATLWNLLTRHGERPGRVVAAAVLVVVGFALLYPLGLVRRSGAAEPLTYPGDPAAIATTFGESLQFSLATFATGPSGFVPVGAGNALAAVESVLGPLLFAVLVYALARRATR